MTQIAPTSGLNINLTTDFAGVGGFARYFRVSPDISYYIPLEHVFGNKAWVLRFHATGGYLLPVMGYQDQLEDRFFLGGDNLRGFADGGVGPTDKATGDEIGGRYMWTRLHRAALPAAGVTGSRRLGFCFRRYRLDSGGRRRFPATRSRQHRPARRRRYRCLLEYAFRSDQSFARPAGREAARRSDPAIPRFFWFEVLSVNIQTFTSCSFRCVHRFRRAGGFRANLLAGLFHAAGRASGPRAARRTGAHAGAHAGAGSCAATGTRADAGRFRNCRLCPRRPPRRSPWSAC